MSETEFLIGSTVKLTCTVKDEEGNETAPDSDTIKVSIYRENGAALETNLIPSLVQGTIAQFYYFYTIPTTLKSPEVLIVVWEWKETGRQYYEKTPLLIKPRTSRD